jgi:membrane associated rhomboid family serine protease
LTQASGTGTVTVTVAIVAQVRAYLGSGLLLVAIAAVYALEVATGAVANDAGLIALGALPDTAKLGGEYWRLLSFGFLHWDRTHLLLNSVLLLVAGPVAERRVGSAWLVLAFSIASVASGIAISIKHLLLPSLGASVGASGGMFGLLGFALVLAHFVPSTRVNIRLILGIVIACGFIYSLRPGISMVGHVSGFAVGVFLAFLLRGAARMRPLIWKR